MAKTEPAGKAHRARKAKRPPADAGYRAITHGDGSEWAVVDEQGAEVFRGNAKLAALIASRLTRPGR